jgi:tetratricopeptide (TPR) repeat protein
LALTAIFSGDIPFSEEEAVTNRFSKDALLSSGNQRRIMMWLITAEMIKDSPINGKGIGVYQYVYPEYQKEFLAKRSSQHYKPLAGRAVDAHNEYLQIAAESGILSLLIFLSILIYIAYIFFNDMPYRSSKHNLLLIAIGSSLLIVAIHSLVSFPLKLMQTGMLFWLLLGIANNFLNPGGSILKVDYQIKGQILQAVKGIIIFILIILILITTSIFISDRKLADGWQQEGNNNLRRAKEEYQQALKYNPYDGRTKERLGATYSKLGLYDRAQREFELAQKTLISPNIHNEIAMNLGRQGLHNQAIKEFRKGLALYPANLNSYLNLGVATKVLATRLARQGKMRIAINKLKEAILYLEEIKVFTADEEWQNEADRYLVEVTDMLFNYISKYPEETNISSYKFYAPNSKVPVIDVIEKVKLEDGNTLIRLFIYTKGDYRNIQEILNDKYNFEKGVSNINEYLIGNASLVEIKVKN